MPNALPCTQPSTSRAGQRRPRLVGRVACLILVGLVGGCANLLPNAKDEVSSNWNSYDDAVGALAVVVPYRSTRGDVHALGLDPRLNPAIKLLHFGDLLQRFAAAALIKPEEVDRGIRDCLTAGKRCTAYTVSVRKLDRQRVGNFWLDSFNFRRETVVTGWSVEVLLVFVDDKLVYELFGGQPTIRDTELRRNPLGPLQSWGDQTLQLLK